MGGAASVPERHKSICDRLSKVKLDEDKAKKILLLGAGECGKSTILKQMKILHPARQGAFSNSEKETYKQLVYNNTITSIQTLIQACEDLNPPIAFTTANADPICERIMALDPTRIPSFDCKEDIEAMWADDGIQEAKRREKEFHLLDSAPYFLNQINRTFRDDFEINQQDILRSRITTTGIIETAFMKDHLTFRMFDVGGQRGERKRWIHSFDDVTAIMFIASLNEYDQVLAEDRSMNRLDESLNLFESISNLPWFENAAIILFLNKKDLFEDKIKNVPIGDFHPDYKDWQYDNGEVPKEWTKGADAQNYAEGVKFITDFYKDRLDWDAVGGVATRQLYHFETDATATDNVRNIWLATKHAILTKKLTDSPLQMC